MENFSLYKKKLSELWLLNNPEPHAEVYLNTKDSAYSMPVHTFNNKLHYQ